jgi:hypothetical protein
MSAPDPGSERSDRSRLLLAGGLAATLIAAVVLVTLLGGKEEPREFAKAPQQCIDHWNEDPAAIAFGQHQSGSHNYYEVEVLTLTGDGAQKAPPGPGASCAVIFAASALDPEPISAAQIEKKGAWTPLSRFQEFNRLAELQAEAQTAYNAQITPEGTIEALDES